MLCHFGHLCTTKAGGRPSNKTLSPILAIEVETYTKCSKIYVVCIWRFICTDHEDIEQDPGVDKQEHVGEEHMDEQRESILHQSGDGAKAKDRFLGHKTAIFLGIETIYWY
jgi:hypothetical protein